MAENQQDVCSTPVTPDLRPESLTDHLDRLFRAAWALCGKREDAEDLVQETFAQVLKKRRVIASDQDALPYLLRALRNTYVSGLRGKGNRAQSIPLEDASSQLVAGPGTSPVAMTEARQVFALIASLPDDYRDVVVAVDVVGLSYAEAATAFDVPVGTVMSRLYRGRSRVATAAGP